MSDFSLMDAIDCGIVKMPRVPITDNIPGGDTAQFRIRAILHFLLRTPDTDGNGAGRDFFNTREVLFDAHWKAFRIFGGVPERGTYDYMRTALDRVVRGKERQVNIRFLAMTNHYASEPEFCSRAAVWEKGKVVKNLADAGTWSWSLGSGPRRAKQVRYFGPKSRLRLFVPRNGSVARCPRQGV